MNKNILYPNAYFKNVLEITIDNNKFLTKE